VSERHPSLFPFSDPLKNFSIFGTSYQKNNNADVLIQNQTKERGIGSEVNSKAKQNF
jgi:hypothetical protein